MDDRGWEARDIARIAVFAALIVVLGLMGPIPVPGLVPITAQTLGVMLAGTSWYQKKFVDSGWDPGLKHGEWITPQKELAKAKD